MKALITGATSGIGREFAVLLARMGCELILASRNTKKMEQLKRRLPVPVRVVTADLSQEADCFGLYEAVKDEKIDILINNAGFGAFGRFSQIPLETELNMLDLNVRAVHILTKLFLADFRERDSGYILNVASSAGFLPGPLMAAYYATKSYVLRLTEAVYEELRREGSHVRVCALCPGPVETGFNERANVRFSLRGLSARNVAAYGLRGLFCGRPVAIPGLTMKLAYFGEKLLPESMLLRVAYYAQKKKEG